VAKREHFFEFSWPRLLVMLFALLSAWVSQGPLFVLVVSAIAGLGVGAYYLVWRWMRDRRA
jgi:hypothetical protein